MLPPNFATDLLAPFPDRFSRALEISIVSALVVIVSMAFQIPDPDVSAYVIFFAAKENAGLTMLMSLVLTIVVTVVIAIAFGLSALFLDHPEARILAVAAVAFVCFFLATASKLAPLAGTVGLIIAYVLDLLGSSPIGEIATRGLLYAWLFVATPMALFLAYNIFFGRHPEVLLRSALAERVRCASIALRNQDKSAKRCLEASIEGGNAELLKALKMVKLLRRQPPDTTERLAALITLSYGLMLTVAALEHDPRSVPSLSNENERDVETALAARLDKLAPAIKRLPRVVHLSERERSTPDPAPPNDLIGRITDITTLIENVVTGHPLPELASPHAAEKGKAGFFAPDAFANPDHVRFACKGTAAVMICYLTFTLLDWPGIHTCMLTCFIVGLTTIGETTQKLLLRITGCLIGAAMGLLAIVYVLPGTTSIGDLAVLIFLVTFPAAWIAVGKPTVAYIGFQIAFALYLCILQGTEPKFDLTIVRDRTIGILFGNIVVYFIFTQVYPVSMLARLQKDIVQLISQCRAMLKSISEPGPAIAISGEVAEVQANLDGIEKDLASFGYETRRSRNSRLQTRAGELSLKAVHKLVGGFARLAAYPPPASREGEAADILNRMSLDIDAQLNALAQSLSASSDPGTEKKSEPELYVLAAQLRKTEPSWAARIDAFEALQNRLNGLTVMLSRYRRLLHAGNRVNG
jgi:multidrug resistance protein MdtO